MTSPTKFYHVIQITLYVCSCDQSLVSETFLWQKLSQPQFYKDLTKKTRFFEGWSWFKLNNLWLAVGTNLEFHTSVIKGLKLKVRKFWGLIPTFVEVTGEKLVGGTFWVTSPPSTPSWIELSSLMDYINISTWNKKNNICRKKQGSNSREISHKELHMMPNSNRNYKELLESKWSFFIWKILLSQKWLSITFINFHFLRWEYWP